MAFAQLEDLEGTFELVVFPEPFAAFGDLLKAARTRAEAGQGPVPLIVSGKLEEGDPPKILVNSVLELRDAEQKLTNALRVTVMEAELSRDKLEALRNLLRAHAGDCPAFLHILIPGESETVLSIGGIRGVDPSDTLCRELDSLIGRATAERVLQ
jgi:DNA polymerase-3 subunit alpha